MSWPCRANDVLINAERAAAQSAPGTIAEQALMSLRPCALPMSYVLRMRMASRPTAEFTQAASEQMPRPLFS